MASETVFRCSLSLPADQAQVLSNVAKRLGCSQSALVSLVLDEVLDPLVMALGDVDDAVGPARRWGGQHMDELRPRVIWLLRRGLSMLREVGVQADLFHP